MIGKFDGTYKFVAWEEVETWLALGWIFVAPMGLYRAILRAPE